MSWNRRSQFKSGIRNICRETILEDILHSIKSPNEWMVLVIDEIAMKIITSCCKTEEVMVYNIATILELEEDRESMNYLSAIYILHPTLESIKLLMNDFDPGNRKYKNAHLVFLSHVADNMFNDLVEYIPAEFIKTFKEIDLLFLPCESQVYSLYDPQFFSSYFDAQQDINFVNCKAIAKKLVTLFSSLKKIPMIRYRRNFVKNLILARIIEEEFELQQDLLKHTEAKNTAKNTCILLLLDRGFDCVSPVVHEFTFQAMAHDMLDIKDDIYEYGLRRKEEESLEIISIPLTEADSLWCRLRHEHIANVTRIIQNMFEADTVMKTAASMQIGPKRLPALSTAIRKHIQLKTHERFYTYRHMANEIMKLYCAGINTLYQLEQSLASGKDTEERSIKKDIHQSVIAALSNETVDLQEKLRLLLLYIFFKKGIKRRDFDDILKKTDISFSEACIITNMLHLDVDLFRPGFCEPVDTSITKKELDTGPTFKQSRWTPILRDILLSCVDGTLSEDLYPFQSQRPELMPVERRGYWCTDKKFENASHLVVFIAGGITYSEMRCAYEVMSTYSGWEIFVGGDDILTPNIFIEKLKQLNNLVF